MKRFFAFIFLVKLLLVLFIANSYAGLGAAVIYKVTMRKIELCTASTSVDVCTGSITLADYDNTIDIAAVDAGAVAGAYGNVTLLPLGTTYTHMRVTIDRKFRVKSGVVDSGSDGDEDTDACVTIAKTDAMYVDSEDTKKFTHQPVWAETGTAVETNMYMVNDQYYQCAAAACGSGSADQDMVYGTVYATYNEQHAEGDMTNDHMLVYALGAPYTVSLIPPTLDIAFGTLEAVSAYEAGNLCSMWAQEPLVTITFK